MNGIEDAQSQAQSTRATENRRVEYSNDSPGEAGFRTPGGSTRDIGFGAVGTIGKRSDIGDLLYGGILAQLIKEAESQLGEAEDCIIWYQNQRQKYLERLEELKALQNLAIQAKEQE